jgi:hypothetical protein
MVTVLAAVGFAVISSTATLAFWKNMFWLAAPCGAETCFEQEIKPVTVTMITKNFFILV